MRLMFCAAGTCPAVRPRRVAQRRVVSVRAESKAATAVAPAPSSAAGQEHEQLQQYGVFKLSYDTANVGSPWGGGGPSVGELFKQRCCHGVLVLMRGICAAANCRRTPL